MLEIPRDLEGISFPQLICIVIPPDMKVTVEMCI